MATAKSKHSLLFPGNKVFVRTVTMYFTGIVTEVGEHEISLEEASWIADTGRFNNFLVSGTANEVEPIPDGRVTIGRGAIVDVTNFALALPRDQK